MTRCTGEKGSVRNTAVSLQGEVGVPYQLYLSPKFVETEDAFSR